MHDPIHKPKHYNQGAVQAIEAIKSSMSADSFHGYLKGNIMKYMWRYELKKGLQDLLKAQWYTLKLSTLEEIVAEEEINEQIEKSHNDPF